MTITASAPAPLVPGGIAEHTSCLLAKLGQVVFRVAEQHLAALGLRVRHYSVLQALTDQGPSSQLALGGHLRIDPATMVAAVDELEARGLVSRGRDPHDRRRSVVALTDKGRRTIGKLNAKLAALDAELLGDLTSKQQAQLHRRLLALASGPTLPARFDALRGG